MNIINEINHFWFGDVDSDGRASAEKGKLWWGKDPEVDAAIRARFMDTHARAVAGELEGWRSTPEGALAYVILLDQLSRNMFRDSPQMYAADHLAQRATREALEADFHHILRSDQRLFLIMPLMHAESIEDQDLCLGLLRGFAEEDTSAAARPAIEGGIQASIQHREIVARFGRFPHRNAILGRASTEEEVAFLTQPGSSF